MLTMLVDNEKQVMLLQQQVIDAGLVIDQDFSCKWKPNLVFSRHYDGNEYTGQIRVDFTFSDPAQETFFRIMFE